MLCSKTDTQLFLYSYHHWFINFHFLLVDLLSFLNVSVYRLIFYTFYNCHYVFIVCYCKLTWLFNLYCHLLGLILKLVDCRSFIRLWSCWTDVYTHKRTDPELTLVMSQNTFYTFNVFYVHMSYYPLVWFCFINILCPFCPLICSFDVRLLTSKSVSLDLSISEGLSRWRKS